jgi:predicted DNA-binding transcriptional regulator AlpA
MAKQNESITGHRPALSVDDFCEKYRICRASFYNLLKTGRGPKVLKLGARTLVSAEADDEWRQQYERDSVSA